MPWIALPTSIASGSLPVGDVLTQAEECSKFCLVGAGIEDRAHRFDNLREDLQPLPRARRLLDKGLRDVPRFMQSEHGQEMKEDLPPRLLKVFGVGLARSQPFAKLFRELIAILCCPCP